MSNQAWEQLSPIILWIGAETRVRCYVQVETLQSEVLSRKLHRYDRRTHDSQSTGAVRERRYYGCIDAVEVEGRYRAMASVVSPVYPR
jgi:hypothetical protein